MASLNRLLRYVLFERRALWAGDLSRTCTNGQQVQGSAFGHVPGGKGRRTITTRNGQAHGNTVSGMELPLRCRSTTSAKYSTVKEDTGNDSNHCQDTPSIATGHKRVGYSTEDWRESVRNLIREPDTGDPVDTSVYEDAWKPSLASRLAKHVSRSTVNGVWAYYEKNIGRSDTELRKLSSEDFHHLLILLGLYSRSNDFTGKAEQILNDMEGSGTLPDARHFEAWAENADIKTFRDAESFLSTVWWVGAPGLVSDALFAILIQRMREGRFKSLNLEPAKALFDKAVTSGRAGRLCFWQVLRAYVESGKMEELTKFLESVDFKTLGVEEDMEAVLLRVLYFLGQEERSSHNPQHAFAIFTYAKSKELYTPELYHTMIGALCKISDMEGATQLLREMLVERKYPLTVDLQNRFLWGFVQTGQYDLIEPMIEKMELATGPPSSISYEALMMSLAYAGDVDGALDVFHKLSSPSSELATPTVYTYNIILGILLKSRRWEAALPLLDQMEEAGLEADSVTYATVLRGLTAVRAFDKAKTLLDALLGRQYIREEHLSAAAIDFTIQSGHISHAIPLLHELKQAGAHLRNHAYTILLNACIRDASMEVAEDLFNMMIDEGIVPDTVAHTVMIAGFARHDDINNARRVLGVMRTEKIRLDAAVFVPIMAYHARNLQPDLCLQTLNELYVAGVKPTVNVYTTLMDAYLRVEDWDRAEQVAQEMELEACWPNQVTYTNFIERAVSKQQTQLGLQWLERMMQHYEEGGSTNRPYLQIERQTIERILKSFTYGIRHNAAGSPAQRDSALSALQCLQSFHTRRAPTVVADYLTLLRYMVQLNLPLEAEQVYYMYLERRGTTRIGIQYARQMVVEAWESFGSKHLQEFEEREIDWRRKSQGLK
ncbi:hypothetical protein DFS34DRAFT_416285 [Phlyctochytrium arcticum]|nr:hypothetical protein DFS34DRAFT_416285 [Phlyctochytrium arcticum]